jgi:outer membrane autotransporter protein
LGYARIGWQHEFLDNSQAIRARFAGGSNAVFFVTGSTVARDAVVAGAGLQALFSERISTRLGYSAEANADYELHSINGSLTFGF